MANSNLPTVAVAIPAYNEEGLAGFLLELDAWLRPLARAVSFHVVDDASTTDMVTRAIALRDDLHGTLDLVSNEVNKGHGPTLLRAYQRALASGADVIVQVDGDGQFDGADLPRLLAAMRDGREIVTGVRRPRLDPWFRKAISFSLRWYLFALSGVKSRDSNCPFRAYRREVLEKLLNRIPSNALVPSVYLTALAGRARFDVVEIPVRHRLRRGAEAQGTMWGRRQHKLLIPRRLVAFLWKALRESLNMRTVLVGRRT